MTTTETRTELSEKQRAWLDGLRDMIEFVEAHPHLVGDYPIGLPMYHGLNDEDPDVVRSGMAAAARTMAPCDKVVSDYDTETFKLRKAFGPHSLTVFANRELVCERRVVGTEEVEVEGYSDETQAVIDSLPKVTRTESREVVEWDCAPLLSHD